MTIEEAKKEIEIYAHRESGLSSNQVVDLDHVFDVLEELKNDLLHSVSQRKEVKRKLDDEFTHYEPSMCEGVAVMRECENGTYIERDDAHLIIDKYVG